MYGEPRKIREIAERLERRAERLRDDADDLHHRSEHVEWVSTAASVMRERAGERRSELRVVAADYDQAASLVREHARRVEELIERIAQIERAVHAAIGAAAERAQEAVKSVADGIKDALTPGDQADQQLAALECPPPGHRDWLDMLDAVPGVRL